jgi:CBS domain-containing protein
MAGAPPPTVADARDGGSRPSGAAGIQEATTMTATVPRETSLERLLGTVGEAMTGKVVVLTADTPADVAARRLEQAQVSGAPVVDRGRVVGVVTLRDLLVAAQAAPTAQTTGPFLRYEHRLAGYRVQELMTAEPLTARADWPLARMVLAMEEAGVNRVPVVDEHGRPVGILARDDVLGALARRIRRVPPAAPRRSQLEPD